ncbi:hypothetical protein SAMN04487910_2766 [Aquimarina amphilecti]|uniref:Lipoprotein n=1 Tax=Aquimarina amphilecti TaxID=1038014 RepID=A0A1H7RJE2_AQUAM|nr:hypothetical protein [Aquimarina amphilecti]SEL60356.1 hypothetical protein SAMN04487910_2766 [Aquimarina amphilecti]
MIKKFFSFLLLVGLMLSFSCGGSDDNEREIISSDCQSEFTTNISCDYTEYEDLVFTNAAFIDVGPSDFAGTDGVSHFLRKIILSDGELRIDDEGDILTQDATSLVTFFLYSFGTDDFKTGTYIPWVFVNPTSDSFLSLASDFTSGCVSSQNGLDCDATITLARAIVGVSEENATTKICFDFSFVLDVNNCIQGTFSGELKDLTPN